MLEPVRESWGAGPLAHGGSFIDSNSAHRDRLENCSENNSRAPKNYVLLLQMGIYGIVLAVIVADALLAGPTARGVEDAGGRGGGEMMKS